jgi:hypothetical protein
LGVISELKEDNSSPALLIEMGDLLLGLFFLTKLQGKRFTDGGVLSPTEDKDEEAKGVETREEEAKGVEVEQGLEEAKEEESKGVEVEQGIEEDKGG